MMNLDDAERRRPSRLHALPCFALAAVLGASCGSSPSGPTMPALRVQSISPAQGSTTGAAVVTVTGTGFAGDATFSVGGIAATAVVVQGDSSMTGTIGPRQAAGLAEVVVTSGGRTASLPNAYAFVAPTGANRPPVIAGFTTVGSRPRQPSGFADVNETISIMAAVTDAETPVGSLTFQWSGSGAFDGTGPTVNWRAPESLPSTPAPVALQLKATEAYVEAGVTHRHESTGSFVVDVHDSQKEILDMGEDFLTRFSQSEIGTSDVLHNFSTTCDGGRGRRDEASDVDNNRNLFIQDFSRFRITRLPPVTVNFGGRCPFRFRPADACSAYRVHWEVIVKSTGSRDAVDGIDHVTAVLENGRWRLCHSDFEGLATNLRTGLTTRVVW